MPRQNFSPLRQTLFDLHQERERLPWYFRTLAVVSSWLALGGYILFALVFTSQEDNLKTTRSVLTALAGGSLLVGYTAISITAWLSKSLLFCFDCVLLPILTASFMGIFVVVMNHALHHTFPIKNMAYIYIPLVTASVMTVTSGILSLLVFRRLNHIKSTDNRHHVSGVRFSYADTPAGTELLPMQIPEDEAQRQQLLRLLLKRESGRTPSPDRESTYRIDLPSSLVGNERRQYLAVPTQEPGPARSRSESLGNPPTANRGWGLSNLMPGRNRSPTVDSFKDPRERRREEIERSGSAESTPRFGMTSPTPYSPLAQPPAWGGSTRYA